MIENVENLIEKRLGCISRLSKALEATFELYVLLSYTFFSVGPPKNI